MVWNDHSIVKLRKYRAIFKTSKEQRQEAFFWRYVIDLDSKKQYEKIKDLYVDKDGNFYLVKVINNRDQKGLLIYINRLSKTSSYPYYMFTWKS